MLSKKMIELAEKFGYTERDLRKKDFVHPEKACVICEHYTPVEHHGALGECRWIPAKTAKIREKPTYTVVPGDYWCGQYEKMPKYKPTAVEGFSLED
jgi:hypothetical protein